MHKFAFRFILKSISYNILANSSINLLHVVLMLTTFFFSIDSEVSQSESLASAFLDAHRVAFQQSCLLLKVHPVCYFSNDLPFSFLFVYFPSKLIFFTNSFGHVFLRAHL